MPQPTAACLIIGDEILTGKVQDKNSFTLAKALFVRGVRLCRVETISDTMVGIAAAVKKLSADHDHVFTSGGVGPTHDDVTLAAVGQAFALKMEHHEPTLQRMRANYLAREGNTLKMNTARKKMAWFPVGAKVLHPTDLWVPVVRVRNVWILPGVPGLFRSLLPAITATMAGVPLHRRRVFTQQAEGEIAERLSVAQDAHPEVAIGSYPHYDEDDHKVMLTFEGEDAVAVDELAEQVRSACDGFFRDEQEPSA